MGEKKIICRCREITEEDILKAIKEGAMTLDGIKIRTTAGMGLCQGKTCERVVAQILSKYTNQSMEDLLPIKKRMPVRPIKISILGKDEDDEE